MRIQHNIAAMNSYRNFSANNSSLNKNLEKLSTGYKINRAGDDAAGLAISEKMRAQISGLEGATKNAKDGISLVQTAEGALTEVHDMLNRMTTLAEQSANGTYQNELDREQLQKEISQLQSEIDRIADSTNFNGLKLLDGSLDSTTVTTDTTQWTAATDAMLENNSTSGVVGSGTILHQGKSVDAVSAEFKVELNNLTPAYGVDGAKNNNRDTVTIKIGEGISSGPAASTEVGKVSQELSVTADEINRAYESGDTMTQATAKAFAYKYGGDTYRDAAAKAGITQATDAGIDVYGTYKDENGAAQYNSEHFDITLGDNGQLKFTQTTAPISAANVVDTRLKVSVEMTNYGLSSTTTGSGTLTLKNDFQFMDGGRDSSTGATQIDADEAKALMDALNHDNGLKFAVTSSIAATGTYAEDDTITVAMTDPTTTGMSDAGLKLQYQDSAGDWNDYSAAIEFKGTETAGALLVGAETLNMRVVDADDNGVMSFSVDISDATKANDDGSGKAVTFTVKSAAGNGSSSDDYNAATTVISQPTVASAARLASTAISAEDLKEHIADGYQMEIGGEAYTFAVGADSKVDTSGANVVDLTDLKATNTSALDTTASGSANALNIAMQRLTKAAANNKMYSVGYDEKDQVNGTKPVGSLTLTENVDYKGSADLTTRKGIAETIRFSKGATSSTSEASGKALTLQIGDTADSYNKLSVNITDMHAASLGIGADDLDISTQEGAAAALDKIKSAVNKVSDVRGNLGALQNRLDHTINNLGVMRENVQNAESQIRDTDVAEEMMNYTKNNILNQSAQAMLAQANQLPQGVLQLLG